MLKYLSLMIKSWVNFELRFMWYQEALQIHLLTGGFPVVLSPFVRNAIFLFNYLGTNVENQLMIN